jgi:hypothetical protein
MSTKLAQPEIYGEKILAACCKAAWRTIGCRVDCCANFPEKAHGGAIVVVSIIFGE